MRRLPVYIVLDISGSMHGEPIDAVREGLQVLVGALRQDPCALETAWLSVITFAEEAVQAVPLTELIQFRPPLLKAGGGTSLGAALELLAACIEREVTKSTPDHKGDWKPLVFLMSDGNPTDDTRRGIEAIHKVKTGVVVACAVGAAANAKVFAQVTENVVKLDVADFAYIKAFFKWVSSSIATSSQKIEAGSKAEIGLPDLPPPPPEVSLVP